MRFFYAEDYWQLEYYLSGKLPLRFSVFSLALSINMGGGVKKVPAVNDSDWGLRWGFSPGLGLELTSSVVPGLYVGAAYQFNLYFKDSADKGKDTHIFVFAGGYRFPP
jgi:hypothetical protein